MRLYSLEGKALREGMPHHATPRHATLCYAALRKHNQYTRKYTQAHASARKRVMTHVYVHVVGGNNSACIKCVSRAALYPRLNVGFGLYDPRDDELTS